MRHRVVGVVMFACFAQLGVAQQTVAAGTDVSDTSAGVVLARRISLDVTNVPMRTAINAVASQAKIVIAYQRALLDETGRLVTLKVTQQPLGTVLAHLLMGTKLQVIVTDPDAIALKPTITSSPASADGIVSGVVTNAKTKQPLRGVSVTLDDSVRMIRTNESGAYRLANVATGSHKVTVRFVGFARSAKLITVSDDQSTVADFALESSVNTLDQVVVTATGTQRYRELGHVVTQLNADSLVKEAPIASLSELLTARVPGLQVTGVNGGSVGGEVAIRIRSATTTSLDPQPIVIVDGIRYKNTNFLNGSEDQRPFSAEPRSPLNDLNVNDIETVEVVKGPSASTLYGPDAANGVIVIATKRGQVGKPQWHVYAYPDLNTLNVGSKDGQVDQPTYQGWGHVPGTTDVFPDQCTLIAQANHQCVLDSIVTIPGVANDPQLSVLSKQRPQWHSGASVAGGSGVFTYFFSGNLDSQTGSLRLPTAVTQILADQLGQQTLSDAMKNPNTQQSLNLHTNISTSLNPTSTVALVGEYTQATQRAISPGVFLYTNIVNPLTPGIPFTAQDSLSQLLSQTDAQAFLSTTQMDVRRFTVGLNGSTQPWAWLTVSADVGADLDNTVDRAERPSYSLVGNGSLGSSASDYRRANTNRSARVSGTSMTQSGMWSWRTTMGVDYQYSNTDGLNTSGDNLAPGSSDISTASSMSVSRQWTESVQLGGYAEEVLGLHDRLFLTGSLRLDGSTTFGDAYAPKPFPKVGLSWVMSDEPFFRSLRAHGVDEVRLRYSYGAASKYPLSSMKWGTIGVNNLPIENGTAAEFHRYTGVNPDLRPEHSRESEYGADLTVASNVRIGLTWHHRRTNDELQLVNSVHGLLGGWENVGDLSAHGFEGTVDAQVFTSNRATLSVHFSYSNEQNKVLSLGNAEELRDLSGSYVVGYPLGSIFTTKTLGYVDSAGGGPDGIISSYTEIISSPVEYLGTNFAPHAYMLAPTLALFGGRVRVSSLFDRQTGAVSYNGATGCHGVLCKATFLPSTPLVEQAVNLGVNPGDYVQSSDFTRWRELSVTADLPLSTRQRLHLSRASASFQVRNLMLWTPSTAPDPESVPGLGTTPSGAVGSGFGASGVPQPRSWTLRFDVSP